MKKFRDTIDISILEKTKILEALTDHVARYTGSQNNCYACNIVNNILVLGATNSSSINRLKNYQRDIIKDINFEFSKILKVKIDTIKFKIIKNPDI